MMSSSTNQRLKLLYLMKMLLEATDEQNTLTVNEIISRLASHGINAERKTIYTDLKLLRNFGLNIESKRGRSVGYYIADRQFDLPELKLLVDAVQSSNSIPVEKSEELISKLSSLTSSAKPNNFVA